MQTSPLMLAAVVEKSTTLSNACTYGSLHKIHMTAVIKEKSERDVNDAFEDVVVSKRQGSYPGVFILTRDKIVHHFP